MVMLALVRVEVVVGVIAVVFDDVDVHTVVVVVGSVLQLLQQQQHQHAFCDKQSQQTSAATETVAKTNARQSFQTTSLNQMQQQTYNNATMAKTTKHVCTNNSRHVVTNLHRQKPQHWQYSRH